MKREAHDHTPERTMNRNVNSTFQRLEPNRHIIFLSTIINGLKSGPTTLVGTTLVVYGLRLTLKPKHVQNC